MVDAVNMCLAAPDCCVGEACPLFSEDGVGNDPCGLVVALHQVIEGGGPVEDHTPSLRVISGGAS